MNIKKKKEATNETVPNSGAGWLKQPTSDVGPPTVDVEEFNATGQKAGRDLASSSEPQTFPPKDFDVAFVRSLTGLLHMLGVPAMAAVGRAEQRIHERLTAAYGTWRALPWWIRVLIMVTLAVIDTVAAHTVMMLIFEQGDFATWAIAAGLGLLLAVGGMILAILLARAVGDAGKWLLLVALGSALVTFAVAAALIRGANARVENLTDQIADLQLNGSTPEELKAATAAVALAKDTFANQTTLYWAALLVGSLLLACAAEFLATSAAAPMRVRWNAAEVQKAHEGVAGAWAILDEVTGWLALTDVIRALPPVAEAAVIEGWTMAASGAQVNAYRSTVTEPKASTVAELDEPGWLKDFKTAIARTTTEITTAEASIRADPLPRIKTKTKSTKPPTATTAGAGDNEPLHVVDDDKAA